MTSSFLVSSLVSWCDCGCVVGWFVSGGDDMMMAVLVVDLCLVFFTQELIPRIMWFQCSLLIIIKCLNGGYGDLCELTEMQKNPVEDKVLK